MNINLQTLSFYSLLVYCVYSGLPKAHAIEIEAISNSYVFTQDLGYGPFSASAISHAEWITIGITNCDVTVGKVEAYWSNWANSYWYDVDVQRVDRSSFRVFISASLSGGVSQLRGELRGVNCAFGSTSYIKTSRGLREMAVLDYSPVYSSKYKLTNNINFENLVPYVTSQPKRLFQHIDGLSGNLTVQGISLDPAGTIVLDDNELKVTVDSSGFIRLMGKKAGAYSKQLLVSLTLD
ncbi:hypothetical protein [Serratia marcescens]|uniref:hypothetical protein n=1 Tax=Serratia marcescens TaxID=615 RepID=UPI0013DCAEAA|nr:hypothetical protein [Serratia marcescens]